jgi:hypothetical protein
MLTETEFQSWFAAKRWERWWAANPWDGTWPEEIPPPADGEEARERDLVRRLELLAQVHDGVPIHPDDCVPLGEAVACGWVVCTFGRPRLTPDGFRAHTAHTIDRRHLLGG